MNYGQNMMNSFKAVFAFLLLSSSLFPLACNLRQVQKPDLVFGVLSDIQYCDCAPRHDRHYRSSVSKLRAAVDSLNQHQVDFVIQLGDLIDRRVESTDTVLQILSALRMPVYSVLGNHDVFQQPAEFKKRIKAENSYYDFVRGSWRFIVLDGNEISVLAHKQDSPDYRKAMRMLEKMQAEEKLNAQEWNGALGSDQIHWLQQRLVRAQEMNQKVVVFCHFPVAPADAHNLWNDSLIVDLLSSFPNVVAYMNGHQHRGNYIKQNNIHFITFHAMVDTPDRNAFAIVRLFQHVIEIKGFGREPHRLLAILKEHDRLPLASEHDSASAGSEVLETGVKK